jgi:glutaredoxin
MAAEEITPLRFYGASWCPDSRRSERFLREHEIPFEYVDVDQDEAAAQLVRDLNRGRRSVPTIVFPDGSVLSEPSNPVLAQKLGLTPEQAFGDQLLNFLDRWRS